MEPLNENELNHFLEQWKAPAAPTSLKMPGRGPRESWWHWLLTGSIRIPVPAGVAILIALLLWVYSRESPKPAAQPAAKPVSLADFKPVKQLQPRLVGRANEGH